MKTYTQICRKTWVGHYAVKPGTFTEWEIYGFLFFHSTVIVKNIYTSKSGNIVQLNKHAFKHKLFPIYNLCLNNKGITNLSIQTCQLTDWPFYRSSTLRLNHIHRSLSFNFSFSLLLTLSSSTVSLLCLTWFTIFFFYL